MKTAVKISPDEFVVSVLTPAERLDAALNVVRQAFRTTALKAADVERVVRRIRLKSRRADRQRRR